jgi:hypothetical protein
MNNVIKFPVRYRRRNPNCNRHGIELMHSATTDGSLWPAFQKYFRWYQRKQFEQRMWREAAK